MMAGKCGEQVKTAASLLLVSNDAVFGVGGMFNIHQRNG